MHAHFAYECVDAFVYKMLYHTFHKEEMYFVVCLVMMYLGQFCMQNDHGIDHTDYNCP